MFGFHARGLASECGGNEADGENGSGGVEEVVLGGQYYNLEKKSTEGIHNL